MTAPSPWPPLLIAALALAGWGWIHRPELPDLAPESGPSEQAGPSAPPVVPYGPAARRLLGELEVDEPVADGWQVERVEGPHDDGHIAVLVRRDALRFRARLVRKGAAEHPAPVTTDRWELFYDRPEPPGSALDSATQIAVLEALAARVRANEDRDDP